MEGDLWLAIKVGFYGLCLVGCGYVLGRRKVYKISESIVDSLIQQGFLKTRKNGDEEEIIPWKDWNNKG
jgi:alpha-D-ribose 1-methylphosphonate 5-triphosphate synthase subunit PhnG